MAKRISLFVLGIFLLAYPKVSSSSGSVSRSSVIPKSYVAKVSLGGSSQDKTAIYPDNDSVSFTQTVVTSSDVPNTASAKVDFVDFDNPGNVGYSVSGRTQTKQLRGGRQSTTYTFSLTTKGRNIGTITMQLRLESAVGATIVDPLTKNVSILVQSRDGG
jgi:hypothetical protein